MNPSDQNPVDDQPNLNLNPNPTPTPEVVQPVNPTPVQPVVGAPLETPPKKSKKGLIMGLLIGGGVLLIGLVALILIFVLGGVSRQDYSDAQNKAKQLTSSYSNISTVYVSGYDTSSEATKKLDTLKTNLSDLNAKFTELGNTKAIKKDQKAADYYKKVSSEKADLEAFANAEIEYLDKIFPIVKELESVSYSDPDQTISTLKEYETKLKALDLKQKVNKDYIDEINTVLPQFISAIEDYVSAVNSGNYDSSLYTKVSTLSTKLTDADSTWKDNLEELYDAVDFSGAINDLGQYLTSKTNGTE